MENQHRKIKGYRELDQNEIDLMNEIKALWTKMDDLHKRLVDIGPTEESRVAESYRWVAIGKTDLQKGLMAWTRAVVKPDSC